MLSGGWKIGRIGGVEIRVDPSWAVAAILFTLIFMSEFSDPFRFPELGDGGALALAVLTSVLFFGSVLAHELAHAVASKARLIPVSGITLFMFGGATHAQIESRGPADEFLVTAAGPLTSLGLGLLFLLGHVVGRGWLPRPLWLGLFGLLARANLLLGVFNLLPGFPLDGGRLLRSAVWRATGNLDRATRIAARVGQGVAVAIMAVGVVELVRTSDLLFGGWTVLIGSMLFRSAAATLTYSDRRRLLESTTARQAMSSPPPTIPAGLPLGTAIERFLGGHDGEAFPVVTDAGVIGFVSLRTAQAIPPDRPVADATVGLEGIAEAGPDDPMSLVSERLGDGRKRTVLVMDGNRLVGVIEPEDLARLFRRGVAPAPGAPTRP